MVDIGLGIVSSTFGGAVAGIKFFLYVLMYAGFAALGIFAFWKLMLEYKIKITLMRPMGKGMDVMNDNAKLVVDKKDNTRMLLLMRQRQGKERVTTSLPAHDFKQKWGKKDHYFFLLDDNYMLQPVRYEMMLNHAFLKCFPEDKRWWARKEDKRRLEKYAQQDFFQKYLPSIVVIVAFIVTFFIAYFGFTHLGDGMAKLAGQFGQVAASCNNLI